MVEPLAHDLWQVIVRPAKPGIAASDKIILLVLQGAAGGRVVGAGLADHFGVHHVDLAVEIGEIGIGADRLLDRAGSGGAVETRPVVDRHLGADALQLQRQRFVIGFCRDVIRLEPDRGGEILQRARSVALFAPEFAAGVEDIWQRRNEPHHGVVVGDGAVDLVLALIDAGARDQRLDAVGGRRSCHARRRAVDDVDTILRQVADLVAVARAARSSEDSGG